jgi:hypothetical protein
MKLTLRMNYDTLIPNLDGIFFNHFAMFKKTSDNFLCTAAECLRADCCILGDKKKYAYIKKKFGS